MQKSGQARQAGGETGQGKERALRDVRGESAAAGKAAEDAVGGDRRSEDRMPDAPGSGHADRADGAAQAGQGSRASEDRGGREAAEGGAGDCASDEEILTEIERWRDSESIS